MSDVAQQLGQEKRVAFVVGMFESAVLDYLGWIGQDHGMAPGLKSVHQPIPVAGGLHRQLLELLLIWRQKFHDLFQIALQLLVRHALAVLVNDSDHNVIAMQVDSRH
jgi:hypothetical protein